MLPIVLTFLVPFVATLMFIAALQPAARYIGLVDRPGGRKSHEGEVPLVGGLCMLSGLLATQLQALPALPYDASLVVGALFLGVVGAIDDRFDLPPSVRLVAQALAGCVAISGGSLVVALGDYGDGPFMLGWAVVPFTLLTYMAFANAFNWQDGSDGVAGGQALIVLAALLAVDVVSGSGGSAHLIVTLMGCVVAFLIFNAPFSRSAGRYRLFMGDAGALFLGYALAWLAIELSQGPNAVMSPVTALWIGGLPVLDFFGSMARRVVLRRNPLAGDAEHLHHLLARMGLTRRRLFAVEVAACSLLACIGLLGHFLEISDRVMLGGIILVAVGYYWVFCSGTFFERDGERKVRAVGNRWYWPLRR